MVDPLKRFGFLMVILSYVDDNSLLKSIPEGVASHEVFKQMSEEMLHWERILRVTGGDLALHKCTVTLMKWTWGEK